MALGSDRGLYWSLKMLCTGRFSCHRVLQTIEFWPGSAAQNRRPTAVFETSRTLSAFVIAPCNTSPAGPTCPPPSTHNLLLASVYAYWFLAQARASSATGPLIPVKIVGKLVKPLEATRWGRGGVCQIGTGIAIVRATCLR
jgi:hypothetical protein